MTEPGRGLNRRDLLRLGVVAGPLGALAACGWDGGSTLAPKLRLFSRVNDWVGEKIFLGRQRLAPEYPVSARTTPQNFPSYSITYNDTGKFHAVAQERGALEERCMVRQQLQLSREMLQGLPR